MLAKFYFMKKPYELADKIDVIIPLGIVLSFCYIFWHDYIITVDILCYLAR
jgi:hypothetical protein